MKTFKVTVDGKVFEVDVEILDDSGAADIIQSSRPVRSSSDSSVSSALPTGSAATGTENEVPSPLSAVVVSVDVKEGDTVQEGDQLITLEAMKMNTLVTAPVSGTVRAILISSGAAVEEGQALLKISLS